MPEIFGKNVVLTDDRATSSYTELATLLSGLNVRDALRQLGLVFEAANRDPRSIAHIGTQLVPSFVIPQLALELILASNDRVSGQLDDAQLVRLVQSLLSLPSAPVDDDNVWEALIPIGQEQFSFQVRDVFRLARTAKIFRDVWPKVPQAQNLDVESAVRAKFGLSLEQVLIFGGAFFGRASKGYVSRYVVGTAEHVAVRLFTPEAQTQFLKVLSTTYAAVRERCPSNGVAEELRRYRFNPLVLHPFVCPDVQPSGADDQVYLVPCSKFLLDRVTDGLVYDLREYYGKIFNDAFGHVVQSYIGELLREAYPTNAVRAEFAYRVGKKKLQSPDWTVLTGGAGVVMEVKKSILGPQARTFGKPEDIRLDVQRTLQKAIGQLLEFRRNLRHLKDFPEQQNIEFVIATWDDVWWGNSILMRLAPNLPEGLHVHLLSVRELEALLAECASPDDFYQTLWSKRLAGSNEAFMDMSDWLAVTVHGVS